MKCLCGYEHESGLDDMGNWNDYLKGDEPFTRITGSTFMIPAGHYSTREVYLFACPKCSNVKMSKW